MCPRIKSGGGQARRRGGAAAVWRRSWQRMPAWGGSHAPARAPTFFFFAAAAAGRTTPASCQKGGGRARPTAPPPPRLALLTGFIAESGVAGAGGGGQPPQRVSARGGCGCGEAATAAPGRAHARSDRWGRRSTQNSGMPARPETRPPCPPLPPMVCLGCLSYSPVTAHRARAATMKEKRMAEKVASVFQSVGERATGFLFSCEKKKKRCEGGRGCVARPREIGWAMERGVPTRMAREGAREGAGGGGWRAEGGGGRRGERGGQTKTCVCDLALDFLWPPLFH